MGVGDSALRLLEWGACGLFALSVATDLDRRQVPNVIPVLLVGMFAMYAVLGGSAPSHSQWSNLMTGAVLLGVGYVLYSTGKFGAGDGKLLAVAGLWVGLAGMTDFLFGLAIASLVLSVVAMLPFERTRRMRRSLPLALAVSPSAMAVIVNGSMTRAL